MILEIQAWKGKPAFSEQKEIKLWQKLHKIGCGHPSQNCESVCFIFNQRCMLQFLKRKKMEGGDIHWLNEILGILCNSFNSGLKF